MRSMRLALTVSTEKTTANQNAGIMLQSKKREEGTNQNFRNKDDRHRVRVRVRVRVLGLGLRVRVRVKG